MCARLLKLLLLTGLLLAWGCQYEIISKKSSWDDLRKLEARQNGGPQDAQDSVDPGGGIALSGYAVRVDKFPGPDRQRLARQLIQRLERQWHLTDLWLRETGTTTYVLCGHFPSPDVDAAKQTLRAVQQVRIDGLQPYGAAQLVKAADPAAAVDLSPWDLRNFMGMYTLQIGFYDAQFGPNFRKAAQEAVAALRKQKVDAYFYQGPFRALITVGLFNEDQAFVVQPDGVSAYSPEVHELQKKFPYNLGNGRTLIEKMNGQNLGAQPSFLVKVTDY